MHFLPLFFGNASYTSSYNDWLINYGSYYHMDKDKAIFSSLNECNTKQIFIGGDRSLNVVRFGIVQLNDGHFKDVLCVPIHSYNML